MMNMNEVELQKSRREQLMREAEQYRRWKEIHGETPSLWQRVKARLGNRRDETPETAALTQTSNLVSRCTDAQLLAE